MKFECSDCGYEREQPNGHLLSGVCNQCLADDFAEPEKASYLVINGIIRENPEYQGYLDRLKARQIKRRKPSV